MRRVLTVISAAAIFGAASVGPSRPAEAGVRGAWANDSGNTVTVGVQSAGSPAQAAADPGSAGTPSAPPQCVLVPDPSYGSLVGPGGPGPGEWMAIECDGQIPLNMTANGLINWVPTGQPIVGRAPDPVAVAQQAEASIQLPGMGVGLNPSTDGWVNFPEWFWLDSDRWHSYAATATVAGVSATATATPSYVTWQPGDGGSLRCNGPGTAYDPNRAVGSQHSDCTWTYRTDSAGEPGGVYTVTATVHWTVSWAGAGAGGVLPALTTTVTAHLAVGQIESVNNG